MADRKKALNGENNAIEAMLPNSTQFPDLILDFWLPWFNGGEFKVIAYLARKTYGWRKRCDQVSIEQLMNGCKHEDGSTKDGGTGLSRSSLWEILHVLIEARVVLRERQTRDNGATDASWYQLNQGWDYRTDGPKLAALRKRLRREHGRGCPDSGLNDTGAEADSVANHSDSGQPGFGKRTPRVRKANPTLATGGGSESEPTTDRSHPCLQHPLDSSYLHQQQAGGHSKNNGSYNDTCAEAGGHEKKNGTGMVQGRTAGAQGYEPPMMRGGRSEAAEAAADKDKSPDPDPCAEEGPVIQPLADKPAALTFPRVLPPDPYRDLKRELRAKFDRDPTVRELSEAILEVEAAKGGEP